MPQTLDRPFPAETHRRDGTARRKGVLLVAAVLWCLLVGLPPMLLLSVREDWMSRLDRPDVSRGWERFRDDMRRQAGREGPVQRKVPRSAEPPGLVWLRDYFPLACGAWLLFGSVLWGMATLFAWGVAGTAGAAGLSSKDPGPREGMPPDATCPGSDGPSPPRRETG